LIIKKFFHKQDIIICISLFCLFLSITSVNLGYQGPQSDENGYNAVGILFIRLLTQGDILNPCWNGQDVCEYLCYNECWGNANLDDYWASKAGGSLKELMVGMGYFLSGEKGDDYRHWSYREFYPSVSELAAGRFFSTILGSLTIVLSFIIGKILFNKFVGITFALSLLINRVWLVHSRATLTEVYSNFFIMLTIFLLIYSMKDSKIKIKYLILCSLTFAISLNTKITNLEFLPFLILIIFLRQNFHEHFNYKKFLRRKEFKTSLFFIAIFIAVLIPLILVTDPFWYPNPIHQLLFWYNSINQFAHLDIPNLDNKPIQHFIGTFSGVIFPIVDMYYEFSNVEAPKTGINNERADTVVSNYSDIAISILFLLGFLIIIRKILKRKFLNSELLALSWFTILFILIALSLQTYNSSRYYLPLLFPIMLIASYGIEKYCRVLTTNEKILVLASYFITQIFMTITFIKIIYFSNKQILSEPLPLSLQEGLSDIIVLLSSFFFVVIMILFSFKNFKHLKSNT